jgi:enoyl-CoA hydratase/carnithine racemase
MSIKTTTTDGVSLIEIARPEKKNALTLAMYEALAAALAGAQSEPAVRALVITGQPGIFTAGNDLADFMARPPSGEDSPVFRFMRALSGFEKPVVAAVTGAAVGIGTTMLLHCDLVYVAEDARLSMPFVSLGLVPEFASSLLLPRLMGRAQASEKLLLGEPCTGAEAVALGLANKALPAGEVLAYALGIARRFTQLAPGAVRESKRLLRAPLRERIDATIRTEAGVFSQRLTSQEAIESFRAFFEKRKPDYSEIQGERT